MISHSLSGITDVLAALDQPGGVLAVAGGNGPFYAGLRSLPADTLLEAVFTVVSGRDFAEIIVATGSGGNHLPTGVQLGPHTGVGFGRLLWRYRERAPDGSSTHTLEENSEQSNDDSYADLEGFLSDMAVPTGNRVIRNCDKIPWTERMVDLLNQVEAACGVHWNSTRHMPTAEGRREKTLLIIDEVFLLPDPASQKDIPTAHMREGLQRRFSGLHELSREAGVHVIILCRSEATCRSLSDGGFLTSALFRHANRNQESQIDTFLANYPELKMDSALSAVWPRIARERPFGEVLPAVDMGFYRILRTVPPAPKPDPLEELRSLVGMDSGEKSVVSQIEDIKSAVEQDRRRRKEGRPSTPLRLHTVLSGPPGTGKTTVAKILGRVFAQLGILEKGRFRAVTQQHLVGQYKGETAQKTSAVLDEALGGMLFIDEAYTLCREDSFGGEAIETIMNYTLDFQDRLVVVVAGYEDEMREFLKYNPGLPSRFVQKIQLPPYTDEQLLEIIKLMAAKDDYAIDEKAYPIISRHMEEYRQACDIGEIPFSNARECENLLQGARQAGATRISKNELLEVLTEDDFVKASERIIPQTSVGSK